MKFLLYSRTLANLSIYAWNNFYSNLGVNIFGVVVITPPLPRDGGTAIQVHVVNLI